MVESQGFLQSWNTEWPGPTGFRVSGLVFRVRVWGLGLGFRVF